MSRTFANNNFTEPKLSETQNMVVGRFAPSPTGRMHAGNLFTSLICWLLVKSRGGQIVLRIEDLDQERSKPEYIDAILRDYEALGLTWDKGPYFQSGAQRQEAYRCAFDVLQNACEVYPCFCTRADLHAASAPHFGEKAVYPGTCRALTKAEIEIKLKERRPSYRLSVPHKCIEFTDGIQGVYSQELAIDCGDFIIRRSDGAFAYQLAVCVDDLAQGVNYIVRGVDLLCSTPQQIYLQSLLCSKTTPSMRYAHVPLLVSNMNKRLSKRNHDASLDYLLNKFMTPEGVVGHIAWVGGLASVDEPVTPEELLKDFSLQKLRESLPNKEQILWRS